MAARLARFEGCRAQSGMAGRDCASARRVHRRAEGRRDRAPTRAGRQHARGADCASFSRGWTPHAFIMPVAQREVVGTVRRSMARGEAVMLAAIFRPDSDIAEAQHWPRAGTAVGGTKPRGREWGTTPYPRRPSAPYTEEQIQSF